MSQVDMAATFLAEGKDVPELLPTRGTIVAWSPKSRARLVACLSDLDYTRLYGGYRTCADCSWVSVAPTAETVKRHLWALCKRYARAWDEQLIGPWKLEFQARGAPHFHLSTTPPMGFTTVTDPELASPSKSIFAGGYP